MATNPSSTQCTGCTAPLAPGARFCGRCGTVAGNAPRMQPPRPPFSAQGNSYGGNGDSILLPIDLATADTVAADAVRAIGGRITAQMPGTVRFTLTHWTNRFTGEIGVRPGQAGTSQFIITLTADWGRFALNFFGGFVFLMVLTGISPTSPFYLLLMLLVGMGYEGWWLSSTGREKKRDALIAALQHSVGQPQAMSSPAAGPTASPVHAQTPAASPAAQLRELAQLRDGGTLSPAEFERAKAAILAQL